MRSGRRSGVPIPTRGHYSDGDGNLGGAATIFAKVQPIADETGQKVGVVRNQPGWCRRAFGMKWRGMLELIGPDGTVGVHEIGGRAAVAEYAPRIGLMLEEGQASDCCVACSSRSSAGGGS
jgi:hypothetical protein